MGLSSGEVALSLTLGPRAREALDGASNSHGVTLSRCSGHSHHDMASSVLAAYHSACSLVFNDEGAVGNVSAGLGVGGHCPPSDKEEMEM